MLLIALVCFGSSLLLCLILLVFVCTAHPSGITRPLFFIDLSRVERGNVDPPGITRPRGHHAPIQNYTPPKTNCPSVDSACFCLFLLLLACFCLLLLAFVCMARPSGITHPLRLADLSRVDCTSNCTPLRNHTHSRAPCHRDPPSLELILICFCMVSFAL